MPTLINKKNKKQTTVTVEALNNMRKQPGVIAAFTVIETKVPEAVLKLQAKLQSEAKPVEPAQPETPINELVADAKPQASPDKKKRVRKEKA